MPRWNEKACRVSIFRRLGADLQEKHEYLRSLGVKHITSSRNGARFEEEMRSFLEKESLESASRKQTVPQTLAKRMQK